MRHAVLRHHPAHQQFGDAQLPQSFFEICLFKRVGVLLHDDGGMAPSLPRLPGKVQLVFCRPDLKSKQLATFIVASCYSLVSSRLRRPVGLLRGFEKLRQLQSRSSFFVNPLLANKLSQFKSLRPVCAETRSLT